MTEINPYAAPQDDEALAAAPSHEAAELRAQYLYRETTLRAVGVAKLVMACLYVASFEMLGLPQRGSPDLILPIVAIVVWNLAIGIGLWRLAVWARGLQVCASAAMVFFGLSALAQAGGMPSRVLPAMYLVLFHGGMVYLLTSKPSQVVTRREYRAAVATSGTRVPVEAIVIKGAMWTIGWGVSLVAMAHVVP